MFRQVERAAYSFNTQLVSSCECKLRLIVSEDSQENTCLFVFGIFEDHARHGIVIESPAARHVNRVSSIVSDKWKRRQGIHGTVNNKTYNPI